MGVSGGIVPCPEALGILLVAIGLNKAVLGIVLLLSFSIGLAVVLIALGILMVRSKALAGRVKFIDKRWQRWLPLVSAVLITLLGAVVQGAKRCADARRSAGDGCAEYDHHGYGDLCRLSLRAETRRRRVSAGGSCTGNRLGRCCMVAATLSERRTCVQSADGVSTDEI